MIESFRQIPNLISEQEKLQAVQEANNLLSHCVKCSHCQEVIKFIRYKSTIVADYNLCEECEKVVVHDHLMLSIRSKDLFLRDERLIN